ncbi:hypothetical protein PLEI_3725 [Photobacterium leiognathi lrivu.4.1]|uniref:Uncharacterized protein n=1 Tax=Photobacterium leiognathi lrivu.4.1 TaxID=1248232 RepID=V5H4S8_PHOLE|nr:hypothetical protein PLEI_3725 [Photobacterium leiognathi lrivu.4.1]
MQLTANVRVVLVVFTLKISKIDAVDLDVMGVKTGTVSFFVPFLNGIRLLK